MASLATPESASDAFARFMYAKNLSFNIVECPEFKSFWTRYLSQHSRPTCKTTSQTHLDRLFRLICDDIKKKIENIPYLTLTTDGWTGLSTSYWSVTASGLDENFELHHFKLGCCPVYAPVHNARVIADEIKKNLKEFGISEAKIAAVVTDEGGAAPLIATQFPAADEIHCCAHLLNTTLRNAFREIGSEMPKVDLCLQACRDLAGSANRST
jgi:hypothetical protein